MATSDAAGELSDEFEVDTSKPSPARSYDYWLGGSHNFAVNREVGRRAAEAMPTLRPAIRANRAFLRRKDLPAEQARMIADYQTSTNVPFVHRDPAELAGWLDGLDLVPPGMVPTNRWQPDETVEQILLTYGVLAHKPDS
jgi:hypothetical protein